VPVRKWLFSPVSLLGEKKLRTFIMIFNTPSACGGVIPLKSGPGLALGFNTLYLPSVKNYHRNIKYIPAAIFFIRLDLEKNSSFLDRH